MGTPRAVSFRNVCQEGVDHLFESIRQQEVFSLKSSSEMEPRRDVTRLLGTADRGALDKMTPRTSIFPTRPTSGLPQTLRVVEFLDQVKSEYEGLALDASRMKQLNDEYERKLEQQLSELEAVQRNIYDLQNNHTTLKHKYEEEIMRLRRQLELQEESSSSLKRPRLEDPSPKLMPRNDKPMSDLMHSALPSLTRSIEPLHNSLPRDQGQGAGFQLGAPPPGRRLADINVGDALSRLQSSVPVPPQIDTKNTLAPLNLPSEKLPSSDTLLPSFNKIAEQKQKLTPASEIVREIKEVPKPPVEQVAESTKSESEDEPLPKEPERTEEKDWMLSPPGNEIDLVATHLHMSVVCCVRFSGDGKRIATGSNKVAQIFDIETSSLVSAFSTAPSSPTQVPSKDSYVRSVCFSPDSRLIVAGAEDKSIKIWDVETKKAYRTLDGHDSEIYSLDYSRDGRLLVSGGGDKKAKIWNIDAAKCEYELGIGNPDHAHLDGVTSVCFSPDGELVASGSLDRMIRLWSVKTGQLVTKFIGHEEPVYSVAFSPDGHTLASGSLDKTLKLWDLKSSACRATLSSHSDYVLSVAFCYKGDWLVSGSKDRTVAFWDPRFTAETIEPRIALQGHRNSVISVGVSPVSSYFATGSGDSRARLWSYANLDSRA
eukprot:c4670_g1_i1.p1 GENE.c4670_g1_i1~~c4670_g1_i1.p1  ORF type:complete len:654 (-),score=97.79 c4670_g1_i1:77-2038(-)